MNDMYINLAIILIILVLSQITIKWHHYPLEKTETKVMIYFTGLIMIILSMVFAVPISDRFIFDMRIIPYTIGSLYGGVIVNGALYASMILFRLLLGIDQGVLLDLIQYGVLGIFLGVISARFIRATINQRIVMTMILIGVYILVGHMVHFSLYDTGLPASVFWQSSFITLAAMISFVLIADMIDRYHKVRVQLDELEKMELVYHLSASVSHEVRNGLTSAHGFLQLLQGSELDPTKREYIRISLDELNRTELIIHDFLTFAKPASKYTKMFDLDCTLKNTVQLIEPLANMHSITIKIDLQPVSIQGDEKMLQQAFLNIFKNAIEAMPHGGLLEITLHAQHKGALICIKDTGVGMEREQIKRLGTPYFTTKGQKGTGLGMMVAYRAIHQFKGKIEIDSKVGEGTTFTIYIPKSKPRE